MSIALIYFSSSRFEIDFLLLCVLRGVYNIRLPFLILLRLLCLCTARANRLSPLADALPPLTYWLSILDFVTWANPQPHPAASSELLGSVHIHVTGPTESVLHQ